MKGLTVSNAPHVRTLRSTPEIMWTVFVALLPAAAVGVVVFGSAALWTLVEATVAAVLAELAWNLLSRSRPTVTDGSAAVTGLLVGMNMPPVVPWYVPVAASVFAIVVVKMLFGGLGYNFLNPALAGRVFVMFAWLPAMTTWQRPQPPEWFVRLFGLSPVSDAVAWATPLGMVKLQGYEALLAHFGSRAAMYKHLFVGSVGGCVGEVSAAAILLGALVLMARRILMPVIPLVYVGTVAAVTALAGADPLFHILSGGLMLGAFFMATDMVTSPITLPGQAVFALGAGLLTALIRLKGGYPEAVSFSILFMNVLVPLIDRMFHPRFAPVPARRRAKEA